MARWLTERVREMEASHAAELSRIESEKAAGPGGVARSSCDGAVVGAHGGGGARTCGERWSAELVSTLEARRSAMEASHVEAEKAAGLEAVHAARVSDG